MIYIPYPGAEGALALPDCALLSGSALNRIAFIKIQNTAMSFDKTIVYNVKFSLKSLEANCQRASCKVHIFIKICNAFIYALRKLRKEIQGNRRHEEECRTLQLRNGLGFRTHQIR